MSFRKHFIRSYKRDIHLCWHPVTLYSELVESLSIRHTHLSELKDVLETYSQEIVAEEMGQPTHFFPLGGNSFALVCAEDFHLYGTRELKMGLIPSRVTRNLNIQTEPSFNLRQL